MRYSDDEYEYAREDEGDFLPDMDIFNRGSMENLNSLEHIAREAGVCPEERKKHRRFDNKLWRFYVYTNASALKFVNSYRKLGLSSLTDVPSILRSIRKVQNAEYKNPEAFVLGYAITKDKKAIHRRTLEMIINDLPNIGTEKPLNIKPPDLLRYARLWLSIYKTS
jgi:hypothetical protein